MALPIISDIGPSSQVEGVVMLLTSGVSREGGRRVRIPVVARPHHDPGVDFVLLSVSCGSSAENEGREGNQTGLGEHFGHLLGFVGDVSSVYLYCHHMPSAPEKRFLDIVAFC
jgi:hypothetical protein